MNATTARTEPSVEPEVRRLHEAQQVQRGPTAEALRTGRAELQDRHPRCHVCSLPFRPVPNGAHVLDIIERHPVFDRRFRQVFEAVEPLMEAWPADARIGYASLRRHLLNHLPARHAVARELERRIAGDREKVMVQGLLQAVQEHAITQTVMALGLQALLDGTQTPTPMETLTAAKLLHAWKAEAASASGE
jgi:hypothetical protein